MFFLSLHFLHFYPSCSLASAQLHCFRDRSWAVPAKNQPWGPLSRTTRLPQPDSVARYGKAFLLPMWKVRVVRVLVRGLEGRVQSSSLPVLREERAPPAEPLPLRVKMKGGQERTNLGWQRRDSEMGREKWDTRDGTQRRHTRNRCKEHCTEARLSALRRKGEKSRRSTQYRGVISIQECLST